MGDTCRRREGLLKEQGPQGPDEGSSSTERHCFCDFLRFALSLHGIAWHGTASTGN